MGSPLLPSSLIFENFEKSGAVPDMAPGPILLYHFIQFERHASHPIFVDPANNFFSIYGDFGDLSENQKSHVLFELNEMVQ